MKKYALMFPGQGAQYVGMGKKMYDSHDFVKEIYKKADHILGYKISEICFEGPIEKLTSTDNSQPAILTTSIAYLEVLKKLCNQTPYASLGLSLGEYPALVAAGVLSFEDALKIVCVRGKLMDEAGKANPGGMVTVLGLDRQTVQKICQQVNSEPGMYCEISNINCPGQIVISADNASIDKVMAVSQEHKALKTIKLKVSGAFHSKLMASASEGLEKELQKYNFLKPQCYFVPNVTAQVCDNPQEIKGLLKKQVCSSVLWEDSVKMLSLQGCKIFLEIGPGNVLKGLCRKIDKEIVVLNFEEEGLEEKIKQSIVNSQ